MLSSYDLPQEAEAVRTVSSQLAAFQSSMEKDSAAQSAEVGALLRGAADRGKGFVDATLQLSHGVIFFSLSVYVILHRALFDQ